MTIDELERAAVRLEARAHWQAKRREARREAPVASRLADLLHWLADRSRSLARRLYDA